MRTAAGQSYKTKSLAINDSTLVIGSVYKRERWKQVNPPIVIALEDVRTIEKIQFSWLRTSLLVGSIVVTPVLVFIVALYATDGNILRY